MAATSVKMFDTILASGKPDYLTTSRRVRALLRLGEAQLKAGHLSRARATANPAFEVERPVADQDGSEWDDERKILVQVLTLVGEISCSLREISNRRGAIGGGSRESHENCAVA